MQMVLPDKPKTLIELADTADPLLEGWFQTLSPALQYPVLGNILIIDHFENSSIIDVVNMNTGRHKLSRQ
jgi:hypothetical protein